MPEQEGLTTYPDEPPLAPLGTGGHLWYDYDQVNAWISWALRKLKSADAFQRSVNEALNTGDGVYRP